MRITVGPRVKLPGVKVTEAEFTRAVIAFAQLHGWWTFHQRPGLTRSGRWCSAVQGDGVGWPDLVLVRKRVIVAELKVGSGRVTEAQRAWLDEFQAAGVPAFVWHPRDWPEIERVLA